MFKIQLNSNNINLLNTNNSLIKFYHIIQNFNKMNVKEIEPTTININENIFEGDVSIVVDEFVNIIFKELNEGNDNEVTKQNVFNYISNHEIILQEIYSWLLKNQNNSNSIYLLGYFNYYGVEID